MRKALSIFGIKREERWLFLVALLYFAALNALMISYHHSLFIKGGNLGYWSIFYQHFRVSGFDCYAYIAMSQWRLLYVIIRHPLYAALLYPCYLLNHWQMGWTGINMAIYLMAVLLVVCDVYSCIFLYRILREILELRRREAYLLTALFFSFASIMLTSFVPDHFAFSMLLLLLSLYVFGRHLKTGIPMKSWKTMLIFLFSSGISLTNGVKIGLAALFTNGKHVFRPRYLLVAFVFPLLILLGAFVFQNETLVKPDNVRSASILEKRIKKDSVYAKKIAERSKEVEHRVEGQIIDSPLFEFTDVRTPKLEAAVENLFGESLLLHRRYLLQDVNQGRPVIVSYEYVWQYSAVAIVIMLLVTGAWMGRKNRLMQLCLAWFSTDLLLHIALGFGITEVYIMGAHWMFNLPIAVGFLLLRLTSRWRIAIQVLLLSLTLLFVLYNGMHIVQYML